MSTPKAEASPAPFHSATVGAASGPPRLSEHPPWALATAPDVLPFSLSLDLPAKEVTFEKIVDTFRQSGGCEVKSKPLLNEDAAPFFGYARVYEMNIQGVRVAVKVIDPSRGIDDSDPHYHSNTLENLDLAALRAGRDGKLPEVPRLLGEIRGGDQKLAAVVMAFEDGKERGQGLMTLMADPAFDIRACQEALRAMLRRALAQGIYLWDWQKNDIARREDGSWCVMDAGGFTLSPMPNYDPEKVLRALFRDRYTAPG